METEGNLVKPLYFFDVELQTVNGKVYEPTIPWIEKFITKASDVSSRLIELSFRKRAAILGQVGKLWQERLPYIEEKLIPVISKSTGYSPDNVRLDLEFVQHVFNQDNLTKLLDAGLIGGWRSLDQPIPIEDGEFLWNRPVGSSLIISSGNTVIPAVLPAVVSLVTGNVTLLRPSYNNYPAIVELFNTFSRVLEDKVEGAEEMASALLISYFTHDSKSLDYILTRSRIGVINYWGGDPGRRVVIEKVSRNPFHPRVVINGPLTGVALIDEESASKRVARKLAWDIILYDQQLCSSPSYVIFIGSMDRALEFAQALGESLDELGESFPKQVGEGEFYNLLLMRKRLEINGSRVLYSKNSENPWTIAVNSQLNRSGVRNYQLKNEFGIRRRFIEIITVDNPENIKTLLSSLMEELNSQGIDKFQTASVGLSNKNYVVVTQILSLLGVYRMVPLGESFLRTPVEPYDGEFLPRYFTYSLYIRSKERLLRSSQIVQGE